MKNYTRLSFAFFVLLAPLSAAFAIPTTFEKGDILVLAINADNGLNTGIAGSDELSFVCFKDLTSGTSFEITDNGWEKQNPNLWGDNEGLIRLTRTGADIPAGTVITLRFSNGNYTAVYPDNAWQFNGVNTGTILDINNGGDQVFFMQNGTWANPAGTDNASYTNGTIIHAFNTASGWQADGTSNQSNLYPGTDCFSFTGAASDFLKYTGSFADATRKEWIERATNTLNWDAYPGGPEFAAGGPSYITGQNLVSLPGTVVAGRWQGSVSRDWFTCSNWDDLSIPTQSTSISVTADALNDLEIAEGNAFCANLDIDGGYMHMTGSTASLSVNGNINISGNGTLVLDNNHIQLNGNFIHYPSSVFVAGGSTVYISGPDHVIGGGTETEFYNLSLNGGRTSLYNDIKVLNNLHIQNASLLLNTMTLFVENPLGNAITSAQNGRIVSETFPGSYGVVDWNIGHRIGSYTLPFGTNESPSKDMTFKYNINSTGTGGMMGRVQFITYPTDPQNYPLPEGVAQLTNAANKQVYHRTVDRFWVVENNIENISFSTYPEIEYVFQYTDFDVTNTQNHINKDQLIVRAYNPGTHQWTDWFASPAFSQPITNTISVILAGGNDYHGVWTLMDDSNPLPIELLNFSGSCNDGKTDIDWTTASETNNNFFTIERSADANTFEVLKTIPGSSNSNYIISYSTVDEKPLSGTSYYRLKQTDFDGSFNYSNIISVNCGSNQDGFNVLFANADAEGTINMTVNAPDGGNYTINLIDAVGKTVMSKVSNFGKGSNTVSISAPLAAGIYFINISNEFTTVNRKVMVR